jgi:hypothetical protein
MGVGASCSCYKANNIDEKWKEAAVYSMKGLAKSGDRKTPAFLKNEEYLGRLISGYTCKKSALSDFKSALECRGLKLQNPTDRFSQVAVQKAVDFKMKKCSNGRILYYERYTPELLSVDQNEGLAFIFDLVDEVIDETVNDGFTPPVVLVDVSTLGFHHLELAMLRNDRHISMGYAWIPGTKFYICGMSWQLHALWKFLKQFLLPGLVCSVEFLPADQMDKLLQEISPCDIPSWCLEMSPQLKSAAAKNVTTYHIGSPRVHSSASSVIGISPRE